MLFDYGENPKNLFLVKEGQISLDLKISVLEIHHLIKFMFQSIVNNIYFKDLSKNKKNEILPRKVLTQLIKYTHDLRLDRLKMQSYRFIEEMNKVQTFRITLLMGVEAIGLEEIFLEIPYLMKGIVIKKVTCYELAVDKINLMLKDEKHIRPNYAMQSIKKILSLIERLQGIKTNCVEMASSRYNIKSEAFFEKVFSTTTTQMPLIKTTQHINNNILYNQSNKDKDNYKRKLETLENIDYKEDINIIMKKATSLNKSGSFERKDENIFKKDNQINLDKSQENKEIQEQEEKNQIMDNIDLKPINIYKKIKIIKHDENPRKMIPSFKSPITDFFIKKQPKYKKNLKTIKIKAINLQSDQKKKKSENNSSFIKYNFLEGDNSFDKLEGSKTKPQLPNGIEMKNLFFFGENKYCSIQTLKKQIKDFHTLDKKRKKIEIIQSNYIDDNHNLNLKENYKQKKMHYINKDNIIHKSDLKKKLIKFSKFLNNFPISFVPISVKYSEKMNNDNEIKNNSSRNYSKLRRNSSYTEKFFASKSMKNIFLINKRNKINIKEQLNRANSDFAKSQTKFPKLKNTFFRINKVKI